eukprot:UN04556
MLDSYTLLLDIKVKEISEENLIKGLEIYDPPRYMTIKEALGQLLEIENNKKNNLVTMKTQVVGVARVGHESQKIRAGTVEEIMQIDMGDPLHSLVIVGENS